ncbi:trans-aconitate methyltransferase 1 [Stygiomarasmius scandens]|uniref:Trans-aconitate methyltransferase 1 n=1 Tax=Marasmiellus scandens TaxID=2682957 RepID=A0ABR1J5L6_9AGAR
MATFAKASFDTSVYAASRPTYPKALFQFVFNYHQLGIEAFPTKLKSAASHEFQKRFRSGPTPGWGTAVDLGCGTGQATVELIPFKHIIGVDPSEGMVKKAKNYAEELYPGPTSTSRRGQTFDFIQSSAEKLDFLKDESVDLVIAAQAAHWFDFSTLYSTLSRILRPNGTFAFWVYSELRLPQFHPALTPMITEYHQGSDPHTSLGPYWERPGRTILERHLIDVPEPKDVGVNVLSETERVYFAGPYHTETLPSTHTLPVIMRSQTTWNGLLGYLNTFSSLHNWVEKHPGEEKLSERFWRDLMKEAEKVKQDKGEKVALKGEDELTIEWPVALVLGKKI